MTAKQQLEKVARLQLRGEFVQGAKSYRRALIERF
jgi:hypothetical protein